MNGGSVKTSRLAPLVAAFLAIGLGAGACSGSNNNQPTVPARTLVATQQLPACASTRQGCSASQMDQYIAGSFGPVWDFYAKLFPSLPRPKLTYLPPGSSATTKCLNGASIFATHVSVGANDFTSCLDVIYIGEYKAFKAYRSGPAVPSLVLATQLTYYAAAQGALAKSLKLNRTLHGSMNLIATCVDGIWFQSATNRHQPGFNEQTLSQYLGYIHPGSAPKAAAQEAEALTYGRSHNVAACTKQYYLG